MTKKLIYKGIASIVFLGLLLFTSALIWNTSNQSVGDSSPRPGYFAAFTDYASSGAYFWVTFKPLQPGNNITKGEVTFSYRLNDVDKDANKIGFALSGHYANMVSTCEKQSVKIQRDRKFEELSPGARLALIALVKNNVSNQHSSTPLQETSTISAASASELASTGQSYTEITIPVVPKVGGSTTVGKEKATGSEGAFSCRADLSGLWTKSPGEARFITPTIAGSALYTENGVVRTFTQLELDTDDQFYHVRGTTNPTSDPNNSIYAQNSDSQITLEGSNTAVVSSISETFSSPSFQNDERNKILFLGVILGIAASLIVRIFSGTIDIALDKYVK